eukprot:TRINITY_DN15983_c0_g1_i1.p1 TRINITY_DN15983_c0_g1~~TRINITY_DN15983_c0_g1_i1.p1  ORF type:complete len:408 (+),score=66.27 TRINITY_DN15983_c0_g1_i1:40-1263(+)
MDETNKDVTKKPRKRRIVGRKGKVRTVKTSGSGGRKVYKVASGIPKEILENAALNACIAQLPQNYNFEIHKTVWRVQQKNATRVALQFPEGLLVYSCVLADILQKFAKVETLIMGDATYGACCVDDYTAKALGCDFLVHYGHSCLVPINVTSVNMLYVFVDIKFDLLHFVETVKFNIEKDKKIAMVSTIQFATSLQAAKLMLIQEGYDVTVPRATPLSSGEILGCTSPKLAAENYDLLLYLGDGRFHLESIMISNPDLVAYRYDPYAKSFTIEKYDLDQMHKLRKEAIATAASKKRWGIILGSLGRQGSPHVLTRLEERLREQNKDYIVVLLSEIFPTKLQMFTEVEAWVQIACPRLSIDWGSTFAAPLLNPYEAEVALKGVEWLPRYPMDFYAHDGGRWSVYYKDK